MDTPPPEPDTQPTEPSPTPGDRPRRLTRSTDDRVLGGVCGGLGRYFDVDPVLFRIAAVALVLLGGAGLLIYLAGWLLVPVEGEASPLAQDRRRRLLTLAGAAVLAVAAVSILSDGVFGWAPWPLGLIVLAGLAVWAVSAVEGRSAQDGARRAGLAMLLLVACGVLAVGGAWLAGVGGATAAGIVVVAVGAIVAGLGLTGHGARWLIVPALALALPAAAVAAADVDLRGGVGDRQYRPSAATDVQDSYRLGAGRLVVDLRDAGLPAGDRALKLRVGAGEAVLLVGDDVCVATRAHVGAGMAESFQRSSSGVDVDWTDAPQARPGAARILLDADVGVGRVAVAQRLGDVEGGDDWHGYHPVVTGEGNPGCETADAR